jgi:nicotinate-nucleotide adenylyltransferase
MARIALFGGSFNPPHVAHQLACIWVLETVDCDELWLLPTWQHPFAAGHPGHAHPEKSALVPFVDRLEMCRRATARLPGATVSAVEEELGGESRTLRTVQHLFAQRPADRFSLVVGADVFAERQLWHGWDELERLCDVVVIGRAGFAGPEPALPDVSSTDIRERLRLGQDVSRLVPRLVLDYIREKGLYL